jgi:polysaccharide deacetylase family protein (PEP-CTERM system associated)
MLNALTIDVEDYFQVHAFSKVIYYEDWDQYECRIERNTHKILEMLNEQKLPSGGSYGFDDADQSICATRPAQREAVKGTFFVLGWIAKRYPHLIVKIRKEGHEIAAHGYAHKIIYHQSREQFREDIRRAKATLEDIAGCEVIGYRAPSYSITNESRWAFEVLIEEGFKYDSSIFPIRHDFYGMPAAPRFPFLISGNGNEKNTLSMLDFKPLSITSSYPSRLSPNSLVEFPLSTFRIGSFNIPVAGGGYFRLIPYSAIRWALRRINNEEGEPFVFYLHPWEIDPDQPRIRGAGLKSYFRHYNNLDRTEGRFSRLLKEFRFTSIQELMRMEGLISHSEYCTLNG